MTLELTSLPWELSSEGSGRQARSVKTRVLAAIAGIDGSAWELVFLPLEGAVRTALPMPVPLLPHPGPHPGMHPFHEPEFLAAALARIIPAGTGMLMARERQADSWRVAFSVPVCLERPIRLAPFMQVASESPFAPLANPYIDPGDQEEAAARTASLMRIAFDAGMAPLLIRNVWTHSAFGGAFAASIRQAGLGLAMTETGSRAALLTADAYERSVSGKTARELHRLKRRLMAEGELTLEIVSDPMDVLVRFEEFLLIETRGWKGRKGTSIQILKRTAAFARQTVTDMAREGKCEIFSLRLEGKSIASAILFRAGGNYFPWKTAFDERFARYGPGMLLMHLMTSEILARPDFRLANSLAGKGTSWMSRVWPQSVGLQRIVIARTQAAASAIDDRLNLYENLRSKVKSVVVRWR